MTFKVGLPRVLDRRLEGQHEQSLRAELLCELVGGEGLAKTHLRVPEKARYGVLTLCPYRLKVIEGLVDRLTLFAPHREIQIMRACELLPGAQFGEDSLY